MKFALLVTAAPFESESASTAFRFARAAIGQGHTVIRVFFFLEGVHNASAFRKAAPGESNLTAQWQELARSSGVDLVACVTAANRRGLPDEAVAAGFSISGLGQLAESVIDADRLLVFGT